jgi:anthranilate/para-aminobenzoate synthase component I
MIIGFMRNDLHRICVHGKIKVDDLFEVERFPTEHYLISTVTGEQQPDCHPEEL